MLAMMRTTLGCAALVLLASPAYSSPTSKDAAGPVTVEVANGCQQPVAMKLGPETVKVAASEKVAGKTFAAAENNAYEFNFEGSKRDNGYLVMKAGGNYTIALSGCANGWANIRITDLAARPEVVSPNAEAQVRFRSFRGKGERIPNIEYRAGKRGRSKRLSVAFTPYVKTQKGEFAYALKLKAARMGPVLSALNGKVNVEAGKNYLIEASVVGGKIFTKFEDEGYAKP